MADGDGVIGFTGLTRCIILTSTGDKDENLPLPQNLAEASLILA